MKYCTARVRGPDPCQISIRRYATNYLRPSHCYEIFYRNYKSLLAKLEDFFFGCWRNMLYILELGFIFCNILHAVNFIIDSVKGSRGIF